MRENNFQLLFFQRSFLGKVMEKTLVTLFLDSYTIMVILSLKVAFFIFGSSLYQLSSVPDGKYPHPYASTNISAECNLSQTH